MSEPSNLPAPAEAQVERLKRWQRLVFLIPIFWLLGFAMPLINSNRIHPRLESEQSETLRYNTMAIWLVCSFVIMGIVMVVYATVLNNLIRRKSR